MIDSVSVYAPSAKSKALLQKAFELIEVSNRQGTLLQEFEALISSSNGNGHVPSLRMKVTKSPVKRKRGGKKRTGPSLVSKLIDVFDKPTPDGGWTAEAVTKEVGEEGNRPSVVATLANLVKQGKLKRTGRGVFAKVTTKRPVKK